MIYGKINSFSALASLLALSPVVVTATNSANASDFNTVLQGAWGSLFGDWQADNLMIAAGRTAENYTDTWLYDRQSLLQWKDVLGLSNETSVHVDADIRNETSFVDMSFDTRFDIVRSKTPPNIGWWSHVVFGSNAANAIEGDRGSDDLYGGAGADTLSGLGGADYLEGNTGNDSLDGGEGADTLLGGAGNDTLDGGSGSWQDTLLGGADTDTYSFSTGWGFDTVIDSDGKGLIQVTGIGPITGNGATKRAENTWQSADKRTSFTLVSVDATRSDLFISFADRTDAIRIQGWTPEKSVGITLDSTAPPAPSPTLVGDFEKAYVGQSFTLTTTGPTNYVSTGVAQANAYDLLTGGAGDDKISGLGGNDGIAGGQGNDYIDGGTGDDMLVGGLGADTILGGAGRDYIVGSGTGSFGYITAYIAGNPVYSSAEIDTSGFGWTTLKGPNASSDITLWRNAVVGNYAMPLTGDLGNVLDGGAGDDVIVGAGGKDLVHGGADRDVVFGLGGNDTLFGDDGNDRIGGDGSADSQAWNYTPASEQGDDLLIFP